MRKPPQPAVVTPATPGAASPLVISPTGIATPAGQVASSVTAVTERDIQTQQYRTVPDVLNTVPGLNVVQTGGPGGQTSVFMRGTNSPPNHTKTFIDGIDVGDSSTPEWRLRLCASVDRRHSAARSAARAAERSLRLGCDRRRHLACHTERRGPPRATASIETGSFNTFNQTAGLSGAQGNFNYALNVAHLHAGDVPVTPLQLLPPGQKANGNNHDNMTYSTKLGLDINENWSVNTVVRYTDATLYFTGDGGFPSVPNATQSRHGCSSSSIATRPCGRCSMAASRATLP